MKGERMQGVEERTVLPQFIKLEGGTFVALEDIRLFDEGFVYFKSGGNRRITKNDFRTLKGYLLIIETRHFSN